MQNKVAILSTRPLNASLPEEVKAAGILIDERSFIETRPIRSINVQQEIEQAFLQPANVVFTSMNALEAVAFYQQNHQPDWNIYAIGTSTQQLAARYFGQEKLKGTANDAASLAALIVKERFIDEVIFFCGDQRRDELPSILQAHGIAVNEIIVYQTIAVPHKMDTRYDGVLFFSPSAVTSFFQTNKLHPTVVLFAIGNTTAQEIRKYSPNKIVTSDAPGKANLVKKLLEYYTEQTAGNTG